MTEEQLKQEIYNVLNTHNPTTCTDKPCKAVTALMSLFTHQLELAKIEARKEYHNEITDNEKKVWLYRKDLDKRLIESRLSEWQSWKCKNSDNTSAIEKRVAELTKQKDLLTKESK